MVRGAADPGGSGVENLVRAAQAAMCFDRSRSSNLLGPPVGALVVWLLWPLLAPGLLVAWLAAKTAASLARMWATRGFDREREDPARVIFWARRLDLMLAVDGAVYGLLGTLLLPRHDEVMAIVMVATLIGIAAVALVVLAVSLRAALAITVPTLLPALLWQLMQGDRVSTYMGLGMTVFLALVVIEGRRASEHTRAMLRLRFRMDELAAQRQQALDQARQGSEAKGRFLATMSHEMRTPLHGILGLAQLLHEDLRAPADSQAGQRLGTLKRTGEHLLALINDVLDYSKIEGQHLRLQPAATDLHALVAEVAELCRASAEERGLDLQVQQQLPRPCGVLADAARLRQVLLNLCGNAVKFTPPRGRVVVRSSIGDDGGQRIEIIDSGPGIPPADRERIFRPFEQLDGSFSRRHGGTGLGLAISRELSRAMGGEILCSDAPGGGAAFTLSLRLPAAALPQAAAQAGNDAAAALPGRSAGRVLLVEDNPVNAIVAEAWLRRLGAEVTTVSDGEQGVAHATSARYDLVLMDWQMPGIDGFEATARIRAHERDRGLAPTPVVALTANALQGDRERSLAAGMDEHLPKPFSEPELRALLRRYLPA